ncbi:MAG: radical SAM protein [Candidatus Omnitrophica bacterium]|nr:radical SAM protein [Candidatus Omnitrophota bacterium]MBU1996690.1 radical SAM protein [Candidatus Omnitrophota bacterium]MBU4333590.1 radical SAM protein [Candidatus Omnitrophota bacterium]
MDKLSTNSPDIIIRQTKSVCPICLKEIAGNIIDRDGSVLLDKTCDDHGTFNIVISNFPQDYKALSECYFHFVPTSSQQKEYYLCATRQCNINCPICFLDHCQDKSELTEDRLIEKMNTLKNVERFTFSHGEPTVDKNLPDKIRLLKKGGKLVNIHSNGVKLSDYNYASSLKSAGIDHVSLQFDGFDENTYLTLRGQKLLDVKLAALDNLKKLSIPVTLNITVAKGINDNELGKIFDFVVKNNNIKDVSYITYCHYDSKDNNLDKYMMPDDLLLYLEKHTQGKILREDLVEFQKLFYAYCNAFNKSKCFNYYHYFVIRTKTGYCGIDKYINLKRIGNMINSHRIKNKMISRFALLKILFSSLKLKSLLLIPFGLSLFLKGGYPKNPRKFFVVTFASICDPYKYDAQIALNCGQGIVTQTDVHKNYGTYVIEEMQKERESK